MDIWHLLRGMLIGFSIAAPVGAIGVLVIRRTLAEGWFVGLATGLGAATADMLYGAVGALGLTAVTSLLVGASTWLRLFGGLFLCYLGIQTLVAAPPARGAEPVRASFVHAYGSTLFLTLTNPTTILSFGAVFAGAGVGSEGGRAALFVVGGVFLGSALWWLLLSGGISAARARVTPRALRWINVVSGAMICAFGIGALISLFIA